MADLTLVHVAREDDNPHQVSMYIVHTLNLFVSYSLYVDYLHNTL